MPSRAKKKAVSPKKKTAKRPSRLIRNPIRKKAVKKNKKLVLNALSPEIVAKPPEAVTWEDRRLPSHYNEDTLVLMVRDPWWLFVYWELTTQRQEQALVATGLKHHPERKTVLRVYDVTGHSLPKFNSFFDIELSFYADNWYIDVGMPAHDWVVELGYRVGTRFIPLLRSNRVRTPSFGLSDVLDEEWMLPEDVYYRLLGRSIGTERAGDSMDVRKLLEKYLRNVVSSERLPESSKKVQNLAAR